MAVILQGLWANSFSCTRFKMQGPWDSLGLSKPFYMLIAAPLMRYSQISGLRAITPSFAIIYFQFNMLNPYTDYDFEVNSCSYKYIYILFSFVYEQIGRWLLLLLLL